MCGNGKHFNFINGDQQSQLAKIFRRFLTCQTMDRQDKHSQIADLHGGLSPRVQNLTLISNQDHILANKFKPTHPPILSKGHLSLPLLHTLTTIPTPIPHDTQDSTVFETLSSVTRSLSILVTQQCGETGLSNWEEEMEWMGSIHSMFIQKCWDLHRVGLNEVVALQIIVTVLERVLGDVSISR